MKDKRVVPLELTEQQMKNFSFPSPIYEKLLNRSRRRQIDLRMEIGNRLYELWALFLELKKTYTKWDQEVGDAIDNWQLSGKEFRAREAEIR